MVMFMFIAPEPGQTTPWSQFFHEAVLLTKAVLTSTHNLCFKRKIKKNNVYPFKPKFNFIKVGFKRVISTRAWYPNEY